MGTTFDRVFGTAQALRRDPIGSYLEGWRAQGDVVRFKLGGPFEAYLVVHPHEVERVLRDVDHRYGKVPWHNNRFIELLGHGIATSEGDRWLSRRRLAQPAFHHDAMAAMAKTMVAATNEVAERWERQPEDEPLDLARDMMGLTLTIAVRTLLGLDPAQDVRRLGPSIDDALRILIRRMESLIAWPFWVPLPANRRYVRARCELNAFIYELIARRRVDRRGPPVLLDLLLDGRDADTGEQLTDEDVRDEVMTMLMAGHESTSVALTWAFYLLDRHRDVGRAVAAESDAVLNHRPPSTADLAKLPLTSMVIDETLRLYPPAWSTTRTPRVDDELGGRRIPRGKYVIISPYVTHRHPAFWPEPDSFRPERFSNGLPTGDARFSFLPFGGGPRRCMGSQFALMEAQIILSGLARFHPRVVGGRDVALDPQVTLRPLGGMPVFVGRGG